VKFSHRLKSKYRWGPRQLSKPFFFQFILYIYPATNGVGLQNKLCPRSQAVALPTQNVGGGKKIGEGQSVYFRRISLFCVGYRLSKHKMAVYATSLGRKSSLSPGYAYGCKNPVMQQTGYNNYNR